MANPDRLGRIKRVSKFISYRDSHCILGTSTVDTSTGVGDMVEAEIGSLSMVALVATAADEHDWFIPIPRDMNIMHPFGIRVRFSTASTTAADTHTWIALYDVIAENAAMAVATTALDTTIAVGTDSGVANAWQHSARGVINGQTFTESNLTNEDMLSINIELDATDASETIHLHGIVIDYVPKRYQGPTHHFNPAVTDE